MAWTDERVELLRKYWDEGHSASQIAELLGDGLSRNAVIGKAHRLGLAARPSPLKKGEVAKTPRPRAARAKTAKTAKPATEAAPAKTATAVADSKPAGTPGSADTPPPAAGAAAAPVTDAPARSQPPAPAARSQPARPAAETMVSGAESAIPAASAPASNRARGKKGRVALLDLNDRICRWPIGHPDKANFHFCGRPVNPGFPYCPEHCLEAYQAQVPRKDRATIGGQPNAPRGRFGNNLPRPR
ncbi:MAG: GcrA family cell cycle regulator [Paracoccaceae bacterium]